MNVASALCGLFPRPNGAGPPRPTPVWQWPRARARCVPPILPLSPVPLATPDLQLLINCRNARGGCAYFRHSYSWVAIARCSLYELIAAVAWKTAGIDRGGPEGLIAGRLSSGGARD